MPFVFIYLIKLSVSLAVVFLFYYFILRKLTFYNHNRWYLLGYTLLSFFIPFINISPVLENNKWDNSTVVNWMPVIGSQAAKENTSQFSVWDMTLAILAIGIALMLIRLVVQLLSFRRMVKKAQVISANGMNIYQVDENIIPFSFGNSIFINRHLHDEHELQEIISHEFVHVKQRHSIDIIWGEVLCLLNWYNPFAWLIRKNIRQNLEFIADNKVLEKGVDKKQYQYLLLKVIGNNQFSIAPKFNFSSLKKRIAMMNKLRSTKKHLFRFLFLLPVLAIILVSFRKQIGETLSGKQQSIYPPAMNDTVPGVNEKGYIISIRENNDKPEVVIKNAAGKEVKRMLLSKWNEDAEKNEQEYGELPPPPPPLPSREQWTKAANPDVKMMVFNGEKMTVVLKNGEKVQYNLNNLEEKKAFEKKYGAIAEVPAPPAVVEGIAIPPAPPAPPAAGEMVIVQGRPVAPVAADREPLIAEVPAAPAAPREVRLPADVRSINVNNNKAIITLKNGQTETFDLNKPEEKKKFEKKYGEFVPGTPATSGEPAKARGISTRVVEGRQADRVIEVPVKTGVTPTRVVEGRQTDRAVDASQRRLTSAPAAYSVTGSPIYIVDGKQLSKEEVDKMMPEIIKEVHILKGKDATDKYGEKGVNGVIIITSKNAAPQKVNMSANVLTEVVVEGRKADVKTDSKVIVQPVTKTNQ